MTRERILAAARRLLVTGSYSSVKMEEIAREAGVAHQTLYAVFGTKLRLAQEMVDAGWPHVPQLLKLVDEAKGLKDPEAWLRTMASLHRRIFEPCADLIRFTGESGDADLFAHHQRIERNRYENLRGLASVLEGSGRLRPSISAEEAVSVAWTMLGPDYYVKLVFDRGWTPDRYEEWVTQALIDLFLTSRASPGPQPEP
ncbi:TetR/AcrR family transcriptional regulator [Arthrobacter sp. NQ7]|uniref:TetR/AcrR family transcriptional regulator n=1 Tax=Arthrobacter sp. NQ7 TaxID=3032303 RepID=UPI0024105C60|nr:TetR/AcrR family transcriptional regulator [Arthrobacter sp. NQ7]MDJ0459675.1 TetR/AcrR family transcriptional regulator [Arthrobacter sp. NQ7]